MERVFLAMKLDLNRLEGELRAADGAQGREWLGHEECLRLPACAPDRCPADDAGCAVSASPLESGNSMPGVAGDSGHSRSD